jgi:hypothetical protein
MPMKAVFRIICSELSMDTIEGELYTGAWSLQASNVGVAPRPKSVETLSAGKREFWCRVAFWSDALGHRKDASAG